MRFLFTARPVLLLVLLAAIGFSCSPRTGDSPTVGVFPGHPRLILSGDFLEQARQDIQLRSAAPFQALKTALDSILSTGAVDSLPVRQQAQLAEKCGFLYLATGEMRYVVAGEKFLANALERFLVLEREKGGGDWEAVEFRRYCCFAWDWLYNGLSEARRREFGEKLLEGGRTAWEKKWFNPYGGGGYGTLDPVFWPAVALHQSGIDDSTAAVWFAWVDRNIHEWRLMQSQVASDDGGMYSGLAYAAYNYLRTPIFDFECWKSITGEDLTEDNPYLRYFSVWWTYLVKPNGEWPRIDDTGSVRGSIAPWHFKYLAVRYRDGVSLWQAENIPLRDAPTVWDVIWDPSGLEIQPAGPDSAWPRARHFEGTGWVALRSGWDSTSTYSVFDCGDFYYGHQHPAENAFTIFRGGSLAINSGRYEWGSDHRPNYTVRTIASNSVLVYDPNEKFITSSGDEQVNNGPDGRLLSNDGGQMWPRPAPEKFGEMADTRYDTGEIKAFETNPYYSYVCGDASAAYNPAKLKKFTRQYLHLLPDIFVVFDRVESARPDFRQYWLLHTVNEPLERGGWRVASERDGRLYVKTVLPANSHVEKIGGEGKEFWVFGKNYPPSITHYQLGQGEQWGAWRLQGSASAPSRSVEFLNVLYAGLGDSAPPEVKKLDSVSGRPGVEISYHGQTWQLLFDKVGEPGGDVRLLDEAGGVLLEKRLTAVIQPQQGIGR